MINIKSKVTRAHLTICAGTLSFPCLKNEHESTYGARNNFCSKWPSKHVGNACQLRCGTPCIQGGTDKVLYGLRIFSPKPLLISTRNFPTLNGTEGLAFQGVRYCKGEFLKGAKHADTIFSLLEWHINFLMFEQMLSKLTNFQLWHSFSFCLAEELGAGNTLREPTP